jgi:hypothetical protein
MNDDKSPIKNKLKKLFGIFNFILKLLTDIIELLKKKDKTPDITQNNTHSTYGTEKAIDPPERSNMEEVTTHSTITPEKSDTKQTGNENNVHKNTHYEGNRIEIPKEFIEKYQLSQSGRDDEKINSIFQKRYEWYDTRDAFHTNDLINFKHIKITQGEKSNNFDTTGIDIIGEIRSHDKEKDCIFQFIWTNHFLCATFDSKSNTVYIRDSIGTGSSYSKNIENAFRLSNMQYTNIVHDKNIAKQPDGLSCGPYMIYNSNPDFFHKCGIDKNDGKLRDKLQISILGLNLLRENITNIKNKIKNDHERLIKNKKKEIYDNQYKKYLNSPKDHIEYLDRVKSTNQCNQDEDLELMLLIFEFNNFRYSAYPGAISKESINNKIIEKLTKLAEDTIANNQSNDFETDQSIEQDLANAQRTLVEKCLKHQNINQEKFHEAYVEYIAEVQYIYYKKILETVENNDLRDYVNEYEQLKNPGNNLALNYQISGQKR